jgi:hypothetical protein
MREEVETLIAETITKKISRPGTQEIECKFSFTEDHIPVGGSVSGNGLNIRWQLGPIEGEPNGAFFEDVLLALIEVIDFKSRVEGFKCDEDIKIKTRLETALENRLSRQKRREKEELLNTHKKEKEK